MDDRATAIFQLGRGIPATSPGPNQPSATDVGLNPGKLDLLETRIETYNLLLGTPRAARGEKSAATANLQQALDDIDEIYEKGLDKMVEQFRGTNFFQEYQSARKIDDPGSRRRYADEPATQS